MKMATRPKSGNPKEMHVIKLPACLLFHTQQFIARNLSSGRKHYLEICAVLVS